VTRPFEAFIADKIEEAKRDGLREHPFALGSLAMEASVRIQRLLDQVGDLGTCKACGAKIWWIKTRRGKRAPYTAEGINHFADCPQAEEFRRKP
jgi:hypothetical protein